MNKEDKLKKIYLQILIVLFIAAGTISIAKSGYQTGSWLYRITHK